MKEAVGTKRSNMSDFRKDVIGGLSAESKSISSKYFYDQVGDGIFQRIMAAPEYYLTRAENEILSTRSKAIVQALMGDSHRVQIIELGAGDGTKTKHLLREALGDGRSPVYRPVDISQNILDELGDALTTEFPSLEYKAMQGEYANVFKEGRFDPELPKCILFLGSNIGNLPHDGAVELLSGMSAAMNHTDRVMVGFDLKKDPAMILSAYNDAGGATRDFNLNLLHRINRELGGNIPVDKWRHVPVYDPFLGRALSYLVATEEMNITLADCDEVFPIRAWEAIHVEISQKYDHYMIQKIGSEAGLEIDTTFTDEQERYVDVVFKKKEP